MSRKPPRTVGRPFKKGFDPRRHVLTREERQRGFQRTFGLVLLGALSQKWLAGRVKSTAGRHARY